MTQPFSQSTSRLDADATDLVSVPVGQTTPSDKVISNTRRVHGGEIIYKNWEFGDWIDIQVVHPVVGVVSQYVKKMVLNSSGFHKLDTRPLAAMIPAGLTIRVNYHATNLGIDREFYVNLYLYEDL